MSGWIELIRAAREANDPSPLIARIPYAGFLGLSVAVEGEELVVTMPFADHLVGDSSIPALHGGTIGALLESAAIFGLLWSSSTDTLPKTINLTVDYLRSGRPAPTHAAAAITKRGRRVANVRAFAWQSERDKPIATADAHFLLAG